MSTNAPDPVSKPFPTIGRPYRRRWLWLTLGLAGVAVVSASAGALLAVAISSTPLLQSDLTSDESKIFNENEPISTGMSLRLPQLTRPVNILVLGVKVLASDVENPPPEVQNLGYDATINSLEGLADTMLLVRFSPETHQLTVLSLPRDTRTYVEGAGVTKLNEANALGGPALAAKSVSELLGGVEIDRYIRINVQGVEKLIDALGGVTVNVPQDMKYQDDSQHLYINLKQGKQHLDGVKAVQFLRFRYDNKGDIGRVQRQQMFMRALLEQALKPATIARIPQILSVIQSNLDTNLSIEELIALVGYAAQANRPDTQMLMLPGDFSSTSEFELSYWLPNYSQIAPLMQQFFGVMTVDASFNSSGYATIAVQDSTGETPVVDSLLTKLDGIGYSNVYIDAPWHESLAVTQIVAQRGDVSSAEAIRTALGFGEVLVESTGNLESDITIRVGQDALQAAQSAIEAQPAIEESVTPAVDPAIDPTLDPALDPAINPAINPAIDPTLNPDPDPAAIPSSVAPPADSPLPQASTVPPAPAAIGQTPPLEIAPEQAPIPVLPPDPMSPVPAKQPYSGQPSQP